MANVVKIQLIFRQLKTKKKTKTKKQTINSDVTWMVKFAKIEFSQRISNIMPWMAKSIAKTKVEIYEWYSRCAVENIWHSNSWRLPCVLAIIFSIIACIELPWLSHIFDHLLCPGWAIHFRYTLSLWCWNCSHGKCPSTKEEFRVSWMLHTLIFTNTFHTEHDIIR